ncbi:hypothetical protein LH86_08820 [Cedecea neteri]|nr:hypothetical protein LH86_08820 [Cedecea neteri]
MNRLSGQQSELAEKYLLFLIVNGVNANPLFHIPQLKIRARWPQQNKKNSRYAHRLLSTKDCAFRIVAAIFFIILRLYK